MKKILLVEPDYNNKYPPIGLMKIATYHKMRGDYVEFYKGKAPFNLISTMDRIYITSLFTFFFDETVDTILHYMNYIDENKIFFGGISAVLLKDEFEKATGLSNIVVGQLTNSSMVDENDNINIDALPLDYDILDDIEYEYGIENNFFAYTTRGCSRGCSFCAVQQLEPTFHDTNNVISQISSTRDKYGDKRNIMLMDNNVLFSTSLKKICNDLVELGFEKNKSTYIHPNPVDIFFSKMDRRIASGNSTWMVEDQFLVFLKNFINRIKNIQVLDQVNSILDEINNSKNSYAALCIHKDFITNLVEKYRPKKPLPRYVDFNQGIDARLLTEEKMKILSCLPLRPLRLAYDNISDTNIYYKAFDIAYRYGVRHFSNYMLYNFEDSPKDFWQRAYNNINIYNKYRDVTAFSFPMKYAPINKKNRSFIGKHWNKKFLSAMNVILNVTRGVIAKEKDFFEKAYGKNTDEFRSILTMPNEFIKFRNFFEEKGLIQAWQKQYHKMNDIEIEALLKYLSGEKVEKINNHKILLYYKLTKNRVEKRNTDISYVL